MHDAASNEPSQARAHSIMSGAEESRRNHRPSDAAQPLVAVSARDWLVLALLCLAQFMLILDVTVVNLVLPELTKEFGVTAVIAGWAVTAYVIPFGGLLMLGGKLSDMFGKKRLFLIGITAFTAASLGAVLASDIGALLIARAAQGVGAALLSPAALALVTSLFVGPARVRALAVWGGLASAGAAAGVLLGGLLAAGPGWRWVFLVNLPVGVLVGVMVANMVRHSRQEAAPRPPLDVLGAVLLTGGISALVAGIVFSERAPLALLAVLGGALLLAAFVWVERRNPAPLVPPSLLVRRPILAGTVAMLAASALMVGSFYILSFLLQSVRGMSPLATGLLFFPIAVATSAGAWAAGKLVVKIGSRAVGVSGFAVAAIGTAGSAAAISHTGVLIVCVSVTAVGIGAGFVAATTTAFSHVGSHETGTVSGAVNTAHELGGALGVAILGAVAAAAAESGSSGYGWAFGVAAALSVAALVLFVSLAPQGRTAPNGPAFVH